jgi:hypothetical protein
MEAFNVFNHLAASRAAAVDGNISITNFGQIVNAMPLCLIQFAAKFLF